MMDRQMVFMTVPPYKKGWVLGASPTSVFIKATDGHEYEVARNRVVMIDQEEKEVDGRNQ